MKNNQFSDYNPKYCPLCNSEQSKVILHKKGKTLLTNNQIIKSNLKKIECQKCGLVRDGLKRTKNFFKKLYQEGYESHFSENENSAFFTQSGSILRSEFVGKWIKKTLGKNKIQSFKTIIEVGCGTGNLISILQQIYPKVKIIGLENSVNAVKIGKKRGLDIRLLKSNKNIPKGDIIISYAVIEHTTNPQQFLNLLKSMMNINGKIILGYPHQDKLSPDIYYQDHLFHFSTKHVQEFGKKLQLVEIYKSMGSKPLENFCLHIFKHSKIIQDIRNPKFIKTNLSQTIESYEKIFNNVNYLIKKFKNKKIAVFGTSLFFHLFYTYTNLKASKIAFAIDDFSKTQKFPFKVIPSSDLEKKHIETILFCINPSYIDIVYKKLGRLTYNYLNPFELI